MTRALVLLLLLAGCASPVVPIWSWKGSHPVTGWGCATGPHEARTVAHLVGVPMLVADRPAVLVRLEDQGAHEPVAVLVVGGRPLPCWATPDVVRAGDSGTPLLVGDRVLGFVWGERGMPVPRMVGAGR